MMDLVQRWAVDAPDMRTFYQDKPTLVVSWWCTMYAVIIILFRVCGRYIRTEKWFREDMVMLGSISLLLLRMALAHVVLLYGTNNTVITLLSNDNIRKREIGSKLVLASRIAYAAYLWLIKSSVAWFLQHLTQLVWERRHARTLRYIHIFLALTFIATVIADLSECQPFTHYWQVTPDPGPSCRQGIAHLITMGVLDIVTDISLVIFPIPMILKSKLPKKGKWNIIMLLALPLLSVIFTICRVINVVSTRGDQQRRTLLASIDILITTFTANAVVLSSIMQDKGYKKMKYKRPAKEDGTRGNIPAQRPMQKQWGSDEDLMRADDAFGNHESHELKSISSHQAPPPAMVRGIHVKSEWHFQVSGAK